MQLSYIFLAESAITHEGKFFVFGGGLHRFQSTVFPCVIPTLALVAEISLEPGELGFPHALIVRGIASDDSPFFPDVNTDFTVDANPQHPEIRPIYMVAFNLRGALLHGPGVYQFLLFVDGTEIGRVSFYAAMAPADSGEPSSLQERRD